MAAWRVDITAVLVIIGLTILATHCASYFLRSLRDRVINEPKISRHFMMMIVNSVADPLFVKDHNHRFVLVNDALCKFMGKKREVIMGKSDHDFFPKEEADVFWEKDKDVFENGTSNENEEFISDVSGDIHTVITKKTGFTSSDGKFLVGVFRDITAIRQAEKERAAAQKQVMNASKLASIGMLAAGVAHEINNPLTIINGINALLGKKIEDGEDRSTVLDLLQKQEYAVVRIAKIVNSLLTYCRPNNNSLECVNIHRVIQQSLELFGPVLDSCQIQLSLSLNCKRPLANGNIGNLQQVFMNLVTNAKDALENKSGARTITIETKDQGEELVIVFSDNGSGIPEDALDKICDPFFTTKPVGKGTGLGLSICQNVISSMNGKMAVKSRPDEGTTVILTLPSLKEELLT